MPFCRRSQFDRIEDGIRAVLDNQNKMLKELLHMSTNPPVTQAQFTADLATLQTNLGAMITDVQADIAALKAQIAAGTTPDFTSLDATVTAMSAAVSTEDTAAKADQAPPAPAV